MRKINVIKNERLRALRNSSTESQLRESLNLLSERFKANGYPTSVLHKFLFNDAISRDQRKKDNAKQNAIRINMPFVNDRWVNKVFNCIRKANLPIPIIPIFRTNTPLSRKFFPPSPISCGSHCVCSGQNLCNRKNIVYKIVCKLCSNVYIGETHRTFRKRINEHLSMATSQVFHHFTVIHKCSPLLTHISPSIVSHGFFDSYHRRRVEMSTIESSRPQINVRKQ